MASESEYEWLRRTGKTFITSDDSSDIVNTAIEVGESLVALADKLETKQVPVKHATSISGFASLKDLAEAIGNLRYDAFQEFVTHLSTKLASDSEADKGRGRHNLASQLQAMSIASGTIAYLAEIAWKISKPYMMTAESGNETNNS